MDLLTQKNLGGVSPDDTQSTPNQNLTPPPISPPEQIEKSLPPRAGDLVSGDVRPVGGSIQPNQPSQPPISSAANLENTLANQEPALKLTQPAPHQTPPFVTSAPPPPSGIDLTTGKIPPANTLTQPPAPTKLNDPPFFGQPPATPPQKTPAAQTIPTTVYTNDSVPSHPAGHLLRNTFLVFLALLIITTLSLSTGLYAAYTNYQIFPFPKQARLVFDKLLLASPLPKPDRLIFDQMVAEMRNVQAVHQDSNLKITIKNQNQEVKLNLAIAGPFDFQQQEVKHSEAKVSAQMEMEGISLTFAGEVKTVGDDFYFMLTEFPFSGYVEPKTLKNQWFVIHPNEELKKQTQTQNFEFKKTAQAIKEEFAQISQWSKRFDDQEDNYHFRISPPESALNSITNTFYQELVEQTGKNNLETQTKADQDMQQFKKILDNFKNNLTFDIFVNKKSYRLEKLESRSGFTLDLPSLTPTAPISTLQVERPKIVLELTSTLNDYDKNIVIDIPKDAKDFEEVVKELFPQGGISPETLNPPSSKSQSPVLGWRIQRDWNPDISDLFKNLFSQPKN